MDRDEANLRKALDGCVRSRDWTAFRVGLLALRDRLAELGRDGELPLAPGVATNYRRAATRGFLKHPDPAAWEAAADMLLATCDKQSCNCALAELFDENETCDVLAARWRLRARLYPSLLDHFRDAVESHRGARIQRIHSGVPVRFDRFPKTVRVRVGTSDRGWCSSSWLLNPVQDTYHTRRIIELIDDYDRPVSRGGVTWSSD